MFGSDITDPESDLIAEYIKSEFDSNSDFDNVEFTIKRDGNRSGLYCSDNNVNLSDIDLLESDIKNWLDRNSESQFTGLITAITDSLTISDKQFNNSVKISINYLNGTRYENIWTQLSKYYPCISDTEIYIIREILSDYAIKDRSITDFYFSIDSINDTEFKFESIVSGLLKLDLAYDQAESDCKERIYQDALESSNGNKAVAINALQGYDSKVIYYYDKDHDVFTIDGHGLTEDLSHSDLTAISRLDLTDLFSDFIG